METQPPDFMFADSLIRALYQATRELLPPGAVPDLPVEEVAPAGDTYVPRSAYRLRLNYPPPADVKPPRGVTWHKQNACWYARLWMSDGRTLTLASGSATQEEADRLGRIWRAGEAARDAGYDRDEIKRIALEAANGQ